MPMRSITRRDGALSGTVVVPGANHFTIVEELARPESAMLARIVAMATS